MSQTGGFDLTPLIPIARRIARRYAARMSLDRDEAEGEAMLVLIRAAPRYTPQGDQTMHSWLRRCIGNRMRDLLRRRTACKRDRARLTRLAVPTPDPDPDLEAIAATIERIDRVIRARSQLMSHNVRVWELMRLGMGQTEIARAMQIPIGTVKSCQHRLRVLARGA